MFARCGRGLRPSDQRVVGRRKMQAIAMIDAGPWQWQRQRRRDGQRSLALLLAAARTIDRMIDQCVELFEGIEQILMRFTAEMYDLLCGSDNNRDGRAKRKSEIKKQQRKSKGENERDEN